MIVRKAKHGPPFCWYKRDRDKAGKSRTREYVTFALTRVVNSQGESFRKLIVGRWAICWAYENRRTTC